MIALGRIYGVLLKTDLAVMMQYRAAMLIYLIGGVLQPVVYLVVWLTVAEARGGTVGDFDKGELAADEQQVPGSRGGVIGCHRARRLRQDKAKLFQLIFYAHSVGV